MFFCVDFVVMFWVKYVGMFLVEFVWMFCVEVIIVLFENEGGGMDWYDLLINNEVFVK